MGYRDNPRSLRLNCTLKIKLCRCLWDTFVQTGCLSILMFLTALAERILLNKHSLPKFDDTLSNILGTLSRVDIYTSIPRLCVYPTSMRLPISVCIPHIYASTQQHVSVYSTSMRLSHIYAPTLYTWSTPHLCV